MIPTHEETEQSLTTQDFSIHKVLRQSPNSVVYDADVLDSLKIPSDSIMVEVYDINKIHEPIELEFRRLKEKSLLQHENLLKTYGTIQTKKKFVSVVEKVESKIKKQF
jgi:hypothetical protein